MPSIQVADKPTLDWIKNKFYKAVYTATASDTVIATLLDETLSVTNYGTPVLVGNKYNVPGDGTYKISVTSKMDSTGNQLVLSAYKNGVLITEFYSGNSTNYVVKTTNISAKKGDIIEIRAHKYKNLEPTAYINNITVGATLSSQQVEINLEDFENEEYNNTMGGEVGTSSSSPTTINGKGVITLIGAGEYVYFSVDGGTKISVHLTIGATPAIYFNETITVYGANTRYVAQTI